MLSAFGTPRNAATLLNFAVVSTAFIAAGLQFAADPVSAKHWALQDCAGGATQVPLKRRLFYLVLHGVRACPGPRPIDRLDADRGLRLQGTSDVAASVDNKAFAELDGPRARPGFGVEGADPVARAVGE
eukprot:CAMPEP_0184713694 /NCGR_PEP_ID=MMETSP0314-20130426/3996_1 /TAXON_ID=38298 /ORGANISM="Rhodella maculata, Strain CCMP 736" /LENGTH=128 /DNA_ID=CAMNT_0027176409 /DNA_START=453 /DNA_END=838 /DNA_ORIENTATION=-